jgi:hypothetical protein
MLDPLMVRPHSDGKNFAFLGELTRRFVSTIILPETVFHMVANINAKSSDYIVTNLDELQDDGMAPVEANDPDATAVSPRKILYLPARYIHLFLSPSGYTLRWTWESLYPALVDNKNLNCCGPLLNWLWVISTSTTLPVAPQTLLPTTALLADEHVISQQTSILKQVLTGIYQPQESLELSLMQMAAAVTQNTNDNRLAREEKANKAAEPKLPSKKFAGTIQILQEYLVIAGECQLPPLWHKWANCTKRQEFNDLTEQLQIYSRSGNAFSSCTPITSAKLVQDLLNFVFLGESTNDIKSGCQPFIVADGGAKHRQANLELACTYGMLNVGEHAIMLTDLE